MSERPPGEPLWPHRPDGSVALPLVYRRHCVCGAGWAAGTCVRLLQEGRSLADFPGHRLDPEPGARRKRGTVYSSTAAGGRTPGLRGLGWGPFGVALLVAVLLNAVLLPTASVLFGLGRLWAALLGGTLGVIDLCSTAYLLAVAVRVLVRPPRRDDDA